MHVHSPSLPIQPDRAGAVVQKEIETKYTVQMWKADKITIPPDSHRL